jgi:hypothetical protein
MANLGEIEDQFQSLQEIMVGLRLLSENRQDFKTQIIVENIRFF